MFFRVRDAVTECLPGVSPVRGLGVAAPEQVPEGTGRGDLGVPRVEHHADVFGYNSRLDAVVQLSGEEHAKKKNRTKNHVKNIT